MKGNKGFTLVEMAIVLVIIGIILGAVIKGNDLIDSAKAKQVASILSKWEAPIWNYYDKKGKMPGVTTTAGRIASKSDVEESFKEASITAPGPIADIAVTITNGQLCSSVYVNYILLTGISPDIAKQIDLNIDGTEDGERGRVRSCSTTTSQTWTTGTTTEGVVNLYYFFDKKPTEP